MQDAGRGDRTIYTVGHSNHALRTFIELLTTHRIEVVVDTRSFPYSRYASHFRRSSLRLALRESGLRYLYLGNELGGMPTDQQFYDPEGRVDYGALARWPPFQDAIARVETGIERYRVALLCSEENPAGCHRRLLIGRVLTLRGVIVRHIRGGGSVEDDETQEEHPWRSTRSASRKSAP